MFYLVGALRLEWKSQRNMSDSVGTTAGVKAEMEEEAWCDAHEQDYSFSGLLVKLVNTLKGIKHVIIVNILPPQISQLVTGERVLFPCSSYLALPLFVRHRT